jgi:hypothetical protein
MKSRITRTLRLRRNFNLAVKEISERHGTVATDSVFRSAAGTAKLNVISASETAPGKLTVNLQWECRPCWDMQIEQLMFQVYHKASHKYWLRNLIRRCR